ncbi:hypothetical protein [Bacteroides sp. 51]|uniref:hypothetical protein n=1 Tax=Bacteroides sp. 51 TaxID=2302938 RepID=UPI0013D7CE06|nr:hypothetical protein [Bacteroides sp. 51]NDV81649.1 hypothetical protein [Bacteroides sp. 51]
MKQRIIYILLALTLLSSCGNEMEDREIMPDEEVYMNLSTRVLDPSMTQVRIIVTDDLSGQVLINQYPALPAESSGEYRLSIRTGQLNFYMILNEPAALTPKLSGIKHHSAISRLMLNTVDLPSGEPVDDSPSLTNLPAIGWTKAIVRATSETPGYGEASIDGGTTWHKNIHISLERMAAKVTLALRKKTSASSDAITVNKVSLTHVPHYEYLLPNVYESDQFESSLLYSTPSLQFTANTDYYTKVFTDHVIPEYIPVNPADGDMALCLKIEAVYNQKNVVYYLPVRKDLGVEEYSIRRNKHYLIKATLATEGETVYIPEVKYQVADWSDHIIESEFLEESAITFSRHWDPNVDIVGTDIHVANNEYVDFYFTLSRPKGSSWTATLTNPIDFMFDHTDGALSTGTAREGYEYKIRIKPRRETQLNGVKTEFYITVNNGVGHVELNLPGESIGAKNRYTIKQTPN